MLTKACIAHLTNVGPYRLLCVIWVYSDITTGKVRGGCSLLSLAQILMCVLRRPNSRAGTAVGVSACAPLCHGRPVSEKMSISTRIHARTHTRTTKHTGIGVAPYNKYGCTRHAHAHHKTHWNGGNWRYPLEANMEARGKLMRTS